MLYILTFLPSNYIIQLRVQFVQRKVLEKNLEIVFLKTVDQ